MLLFGKQVFKVGLLPVQQAKLAAEPEQFGGWLFLDGIGLSRSSQAIGQSAVVILKLHDFLPHRFVLKAQLFLLAMLHEYRRRAGNDQRAEPEVEFCHCHKI